MSVGQDLLDLPFAEMVRNLAFAIAEGQLELDRSSIETLDYLINHNVQVVPEITEILEPIERQVTIGPPDDEKQITITGTRIRPSGAAPINLSLLQAGLLPTFYQFTEASIEVKLSVSMKSTANSESTGGSNLGVGSARYKTRAYSSPVNFRTANTYSYSADGSSVLRVTMRPVPPPPRLTPSVTTINTLVTPPTMSRTD